MYNLLISIHCLFLFIPLSTRATGIQYQIINPPYSLNQSQEINIYKVVLNPGSDFYSIMVCNDNRSNCDKSYCSGSLSYTVVDANNSIAYTSTTSSCASNLVMTPQRIVKYSIKLLCSSRYCDSGGRSLFLCRYYKSSSRPLAPGAMSGIVIAGIIVSMIVGCCVYCCRRCSSNPHYNVYAAGAVYPSPQIQPGAPAPYRIQQLGSPMMLPVGQQQFSPQNSSPFTGQMVLSVPMVQQPQQYMYPVPAQASYTLPPQGQLAMGAPYNDAVPVAQPIPR